MPENGCSVSLFPDHGEDIVGVGAFLLVSGKRLTEDFESEAKEAYEHVNKIGKGIVYFIANDHDFSFIYPSDRHWYFVDENDNDDSSFLSTRKRCIAGALLNICIDKYHRLGVDFDIPKVIQHDLWSRLSKSISIKMKVWELAFLMYPVIDMYHMRFRKKYRAKRRNLMLDILDDIKRGNIESVLSLKREKEYWMLDINKQVDIVVSLGQVKKTNKYSRLVFLWEGFMGCQVRRGLSQSIPEEIDIDYMSGTVGLKKPLPKGDFMDVANFRDYLDDSSEDKNTVMDWEELPVVPVVEDVDLDDEELPVVVVIEDEDVAQDHEKDSGVLAIEDRSVEQDRKESPVMPVIDKKKKLKGVRGKGANYDLIKLGCEAFKVKYGVHPNSGGGLWDEVIELLPQKNIVLDENKKGEAMIRWSDKYCTRPNFLRTYNRYFKVKIGQ